MNVLSELEQIILWSPLNSHTGMCDRLRGVAAVAVFADALGKKLSVTWGSCPPCPILFEEVFEQSAYFSTNFHGGTANGAESWNFEFNIMPLELAQRFREGRVPGGLRVELSDEEVMRRWGEVLRSVVPRLHLRRKIERLKKRMNLEKALGIHLRRTDVFDSPARRITRETAIQHDAALWARVTQAIDRGEVSHVYLAADDQSYFESWKKRLEALPVEVVFHQADWGSGLRQTSVEDFVVDLYLLIASRKVYGSVWSSLFYVGEAMGGSFEIVEPPVLGAVKNEEGAGDACGGEGRLSTALKEEGPDNGTSRQGLSAVTVSVNYSDLLAGVTANRRHFDEWIVVTTPGDGATQALCEKHGMVCLTTEVFFDQGASFHKAAGLNLGIEAARAGNWVVSLDSDILLPSDFREVLDGLALDPSCLYGLKGRCLCREREDLELLKVTEPWEALTIEENPWVLGYFQMFHPENPFVRRFDEEVSDNASGYDDDFARKFGPRYWRFLPVSAVHLGEANVNWRGRPPSDDVAWLQPTRRDPVDAVRQMLGELEFSMPRVLVIGAGTARIAAEIRGLSSEVVEWELAADGSRKAGDGREEDEPSGKYEVLVFSCALSDDDFQQVLSDWLPLLKKEGVVIGPWFDAVRWPEWTAEVAQHLGMPRKILEGWWEVPVSDISPTGRGETDQGKVGAKEVVFVPISKPWVSRAALALQSLRHFWQGRIVVGVPEDLPGRWAGIAGNFQAELHRVSLPRPGEWADQWGRDDEKLALVMVEGLVAERTAKVIVWHPGTICVSSPEPLFHDLKENEAVFSNPRDFGSWVERLGWEQGEAGAGELPVGERAVKLDRVVLGRCKRQLWELLALPSSLLRAREFPMPWNFYRELSGTTKALPGEKVFREVFELGEEEDAGVPLAGIYFPLDSETCGKLICERWAELEQEVAVAFSSEVPVDPSLTIVVRVGPESLDAFYFNFRLWRFPDTTAIHVFFSGLETGDFFFVEEKPKVEFHELNPVSEAGGDFFSAVAGLGLKGRVAFISPNWKPRPGAHLGWLEPWKNFEICGTHFEWEMDFDEFQKWEAWGDGQWDHEGRLLNGGRNWSESIKGLRVESFDGDFLLVGAELLEGFVGSWGRADQPFSDPLLALWYLAHRQGRRIGEFSLEETGWTLEEHRPTNGEGGAEPDIATGGDDPSPKSLPGSPEPGQVGFITLSNAGYLPYTLNCHESLRRLGKKGEELAAKLVCYSIGKDCHEQLQAAGVQSVLIEDEDHSDFQVFRKGGWSEVVKYKFEAISRELEKNDFVCFTDGDIVFEGDDFLEECITRIDEEKAELLIQNDAASLRNDDHSNLCSGFMLIRSTAKTRKAFSFDLIRELVDKSFSDQLYVNATIRKMVQTSVLPLEAFPNGAFLHAYGAPPSAKMLHFNYLVGHQKQEMMKRFARWYVPTE